MLLETRRRRARRDWTRLHRREAELLTALKARGFSDPRDVPNGTRRRLWVKAKDEGLTTEQEYEWAASVAGETWDYAGD
jgi:hypothetical protein